MNDTQTTLQARARKKFLSNSLASELVKLASPLNKQYALTFGCCKVLDIDQDYTLRSMYYCQKRWCLTCASIKMATQINNYIEPIKSLPNLQFVTLTVPNCTKDNLKSTLDTMLANYRKCIDRGRKQGRKLIGLRKLELKVGKNGLYHPHYHIILSGSDNAEYLVQSWLHYNSTARRVAQDISPVRDVDTALLELMKYATKLTCSDDASNQVLCSAYQMDVIFQALQKRRLYQPFGGLKVASEDLFEPSNPQIIERAKGLYQWVGFDWYHIRYTQALSHYHPEQTELAIYRRNNTAAPPKQHTK